MVVVVDVVSVVVDAGVWDVEEDAEEIAVLDIGSAVMLEIKEKDWDEEELAVLDICSAAALEIEEEDWDEEDLADANKILDNSFFE